MIRIQWNGRNLNLDWLRRMVGTLEKRGFSLDGGSTWFGSVAHPTASGVRVTAETAIQQVTVYSCVAKISSSIGSLPFITYRRLGVGKTRATDYYLFNILQNQPNPDQTRMEFFEQMIPGLELRGDAYAEIVRDGADRVTALWPIEPNRVQVGRVDGRRRYLVTMADGTRRQMPIGRMYHLMGMSLDGLTGLSRIEECREAVGLAMATDTFGAGFFGNGSKPGGIIKLGGIMEDEDQKAFKKEWERAHQGLGAMHRIAFLEEGMEWQQTTIPPDDAQFIETKKFSVTELARLFDVPPHMIGAHDEGATFASVEQQVQDWVTHSIRPRAVRIEQISNLLVMISDRPQIFTEFLFDALLRGDSKTRSEVYGSAITNGWMTRNEVRAKENMNPLPGLDEPLMPLNVTTVAKFEAGDTGAGDPAGDSRAEPYGDFETREARAVTRSKMGDTFLPLILDAARRVVKREVRELVKAFNKHLGSRDALSFQRFLDEFFGEEVPDFVRELMQGPLTAYGLETGNAAIKEIGGDSFDIDAFFDVYLGKLGDGHAAKSRRAIDAVLELPIDEQREAFDNQMEAWIEGSPGALPRADNIANREVVAMGAAAAAVVWKGGGVTKLRWVLVGESCPLCEELDGKIVGIDQSFASAGEVINPNKPGQPREDDRPSLTVRSDTFHPPLHGGCDCIIVPEG